MEKDLLLAIPAHITTIVVAVGGWIFTWKMQRQARAMERLERRVKLLRAEVLARIEHENISVERLSESCAIPHQTIKVQLRDAALTRCGIRPRLTKSQVERM